MGGKGQLSAEMLILIAVVLAVLVLVASQLMKTAAKASEKIDLNTEAVMNASDQAIAASKPCSSDSDCPAGYGCNSFKSCVPKT